jgi:hypothetical protein
MLKPTIYIPSPLTRLLHTAPYLALALANRRPTRGERDRADRLPPCAGWALLLRAS